ncbi:MAG: PAS domain S-box protein, partial [Proteobacteria bacterium]|nr:PAS domain S-box protein [Pseudomonadota bacterium]
MATKDRVHRGAAGGQSGGGGGEVAALRRRVAGLSRELGLCNERLEESQRISRIGSWDWDLSDGSVFCSPETLRIFGIAPGAEAQTVEMFLALIHADDRPAVDEVLATTLATGGDVSVEYRVARSDGSGIRVRARGRCVTNETGAVARLHGTVQDVTERHCAKQQLREQARLLDRIFRHSIENIVLLDREFRYVRVSDSFLSLARRPVSDLIGRSAFALYDSGFEGEAREVGRTKVARTWNARPFSIPGSPRGTTYMDISMAPILDDAGEVELFLITLEDATQREQSGQALRRSEERLQLVMRSVSDGIWDWNVATGEFYLSPRWKEILGFGDDELPNRESSFFGRVHPEDVEALREALDGHLEQDRPYHVDLRMRHSNGGYRWVLCRGVAVRDDSGHVVRMAGSIRDITDQVEADAQLRQSEAHHRLVLSSMQEVVVVVDTAGVIRSVNGAAESVFGYRAEELAGENVTLLMAAGVADQHHRNLREFGRT